MSKDYRNACNKGVLAAAHLHKELSLQSKVSEKGSNIRIFEIINNLKIPMIFQPVNGILGVFIKSPNLGMLVASNTPKAVQRFTAAHELGHYLLDHKSSVDSNVRLGKVWKEQVLFEGDLKKIQELEANSFAVEFLTPRWLIETYRSMQGWSNNTIKYPKNLYQLSLRIGLNYTATCWALCRHDYLTVSETKKLLEVKPSEIKSELAGNVLPEGFEGEVWHITKRDDGQFLDCNVDDYFVFDLLEHGHGGYLWDFRHLSENNLSIVADCWKKTVDRTVHRQVIARSSDSLLCEFSLLERRRWEKM